MDLEQITGGENKTTEFLVSVANVRQYTDEIKKTVSAFANTEGGTLYIGVDDDGSIVGVDDPDGTMLALSNSVQMSIKPDVSRFIDYHKETLGGKNVIVVTIQKGTASPYYLAGKGIRPEGVFIRNGASSVYATESAILDMIKESDGTSYENIRSLNQDLTFTQAENFFKERNLAFGAEQQVSLNVKKPDGIFTNLGLLISDQSPHTVRVAVYEGQEKEIFKDRKEFHGSILQQLSQIYEFLDMYNHTFAKVEGLYRKDRRDYPEEALREALLNALVHRDYAFSASTLISIFDDRLEFLSIGGLAKGITLNDIMLGVSVPRNQHLAALFYRLHLIEVYGTGIPKIMRSYEDQSRKPTLETSDHAFKITLPNRNINAAPMEISGLSENEMAIMKLCARQPDIQRHDVETTLGLSQAMAGRLLKRLMDKGLLRSRGGGKNTRYEKVAIDL
jgi:ATP-dependent DNA helicase RecG